MSNNGSTVTDSSDTSIWKILALTVYEFNTWIIVVYFVPAMILVGLLNNGLTLAVFLSRHARTIGISESLRLYYSAFAAADLLSLLTSHLVDFNAYGFNKLFGTNVDLMWWTSGPAACKVIWFVMQLCETLSSWLMATLSAERVFALYWPLRHRAANNKRLTQWALVGVTAATLLMATPSLCFANIISIYGYTIKHCIPDVSEYSWIVMVSFLQFSVFNVYLFPEVVHTTCTLLILFKLISGAVSVSVSYTTRL